ncbi:MAG: hypothetical protein ACLFTQ_00465 [Candidatus Aenigmatarchaeota archaeon]
MGRYDFLEDEELRGKLEKKQEEAISRRKREEVKKSRDKSKEQKDEGPRVYTKEDGHIGGVIYPEDKDKPRKTPETTADKVMGPEEKGEDEGKKEEEDLPVNLHHTKNTKVGSKDRPNPGEANSSETEEDQKEKGKDVKDARKSIWQ